MEPDPIIPDSLAARLHSEPAAARKNGHLGAGSKPTAGPPLSDSAVDEWWLQPWDEERDGYIDPWYSLSDEEQRNRLRRAGLQALRDIATKCEDPLPEEKKELEAEYREFLAEIEDLLPAKLVGPFTNFAVQDSKDAKGKSVTNKVGVTVTEIANLLRRITGGIGNERQRVTGGWPKRVGGLLFAEKDYKPGWLEDVSSLFAWISGMMKEPIQWAAGDDKVSQSVFNAYLRQQVDEYDAMELLPHQPPIPRHYYMHPAPAGGDGKALKALLDRFNPATKVDRALMMAAFLTPFWGGRPGSRPAFLVVSDDDDGKGGRGTGKTTFAEMVAELAGGHCDVRPSEDIDKIMTRLLSSAGLERRVCLLDNVKTMKFSWSDLEALITTNTISGRKLYVGEGRRPNTLTWFITLNGANLSKDMAQRCVIIQVKRPTFDGTWRDTTRQFIEDNKWEIIGDVIAALFPEEKGGGRLTRYTRWADWESEVLACVDDPSKCQEMIAERQAAVDGDQEDSDLVREAFVTFLKADGKNPDKDVVFFPTQMAANIVNQVTNEPHRPTQRTTTYLGTLSITELRKSNWTGGGRGWRWTGKESAPDAKAVKAGIDAKEFVAGLNARAEKEAAKKKADKAGS